MAARKTTKARKKTTQRRVAVRKDEQPAPRLIDSFNLADSYTSLILGIVAVIIVIVLLVAFIRGRNDLSGQNGETSSTNTEESQVKTYIVQSGDDLWSIAENELGSGYEWVTIAEENNISDPNQIEKGTELKIPAISPASPSAGITAIPTQAQAREEEAGTNKTFTVSQGDSLWSIAQATYNDGYRWVEIAQANNISNPDLIYPGTTLSLPR